MGDNFAGNRSATGYRIALLMSKSVRIFTTVTVGILAIYVLYNVYVNSAEVNQKRRHIEDVINSMEIVTDGLARNPINRFWSLGDEASGNSWRLYFTLTFPYDDADRARGEGNQPWQAESLRQWDDDIHRLFCLKKDVDLPRDKRYTHLMAIRGVGSAFEFMDREGIEELRRTAPQAILLTEVCNSTVPWMQAGDLELDTIPREINSSEKLGIGSAHGYDQFAVGFADGEVWLLDSSIPFSKLGKFLTVESAQKHDRKNILGKYGGKVIPNNEIPQSPAWTRWFDFVR